MDARTWDLRQIPFGDSVFYVFMGNWMPGDTSIVIGANLKNGDPGVYSVDIHSPYAMKRLPREHYGVAY